VAPEKSTTERAVGGADYGHTTKVPGRKKRGAMKNIGYTRGREKDKRRVQSGSRNHWNRHPWEGRAHAPGEGRRVAGPIGVVKKSSRKGNGAPKQSLGEKDAVICFGHLGEKEQRMVAFLFKRVMMCLGQRGHRLSSAKAGA